MGGKALLHAQNEEREKAEAVRIASWIIGSVCMPGSTVLVVGPGADGGEVMGAVVMGCNVVAIEKNKYQYEQLQANLLHVKEKLRKQYEDDKSLGSGEDREEVLESQACTAGDQYNEMSGAEGERRQRVRCRSCGQLVQGEALTYARSDCTQQEYLFRA